MVRTSTVSIRVGQCLLVVLAAFNVYRAATQSLTTDEAMTYTRFVQPPFAETWRLFDANNHVLNTLLVRCSVAVLGAGEFALRLPTLLVGFLYLAGVWRLARRWFGSGALFLACLGLLCANPLVLDYLVACRGYGMALAGWIWGLIWLTQAAETGDRRSMTAGALALALAFCANLAFVFPIAATALVFAALEVARRGRAALAPLADRFLIPAVVSSFLILLLPLQYALPGSFYYGAKMLRGALTELAEISLFHATPRFTSVHEFVLVWFPRFCLPLGLAILWATLRAMRRRAAAPADTLLILTGGTAALAFAAIFAAHQAFGMPYPLNRTAVYWIPLLSMLSLAAVRECGWKPLTGAAIAAVFLLVACYVIHIRPDHFAEWPEDAAIKRIAERLRAEAGNRPLRLCAPHAQATTLSYYRLRFGMSQWTILKQPDSQTPCDWRLAK